MSNSNIVHLASYSRERLQQEMADGDADIERELQVCPGLTMEGGADDRPRVRPGTFEISELPKSSMRAKVTEMQHDTQCSISGTPSN
jgi:hypothetical protein